MFNIAKALFKCHQEGVIHRDLKMENIMIHKNLSIKLIDFGYGTVMMNSEERFIRYCGTPYYMPPEMVQKLPYDGILCFFINKRKKN